MVKSVVARKATEVARKRELLNFEAANVVLDEGIRSLRKEQSRKITKKKPIVKNLKYVFNCLARKKAKTYKELYYKTLSRNHILDLSDTSKDSQLTRMSKQEREAILKKNFPMPSTQAKDFTPIEKHIKKIKDSKKSLKMVLSGIKKENSRSTFIDKSKQLTKFVLKKHIEEEYIFDSEVIKTFSEGDYLAKFWSPIIEKLFRNSGIIPHWGDTQPTTLISEGIQMKMDLRLVSVASKVCKNLSSDHGSGEFAPAFSQSKYYKDKRKAVIASKSALNIILSKNKSVNIHDLFAPYIIVMGFQMHLCFLGLTDNKLYYTKKLKTLTFPTTINDIYPSIRNLVEGLYELLEMCLFMKTSATRGTKRKSMDLVLGDHSDQDAPVCISKVVWVEDDVIDDDTETDDIEDTEDDDTDDSETDVTEEFKNSDEVDDTETNDIQDSQTEDV